MFDKLKYWAKNSKLAAWLKAAGIRAIKTMAQTAAGILTGSTLLGQVDWKMVASASVFAAVYSLITSIKGLPELKDTNGDGIPDSF